MRIFVTGATGFIGSVLVPELISAGHQVLGLTRSEAGAEKLRAAGAEFLHGNLEDLDSLRKGAERADGVIHLAFSHNFSQFEKNAADERAAIAALGEVLQGSVRPFVVTSGTALAANVDGQPSTEDSPTASWNPRAGLETIMQTFTERGVKTSIVRLAQIHDTHKQGLVPYFTAVAREKRVSAYIGDGGNRWPAAHVSDTARLYRLAFENAEAGAIYHVVDEEGVAMKTIAAALGRGLKVPVVSIKPEDSQAQFGWLSMFAGHDMPSSSSITRQKLNWKPTGPGLIADLDAMDYTQF
ncbi:MAG: NAD-dependent dehydratase [Acidiphilium sp. 37-64-53]|uniref:SDR family oxidoreductase n=1 Tax=unclassified Acidiphilium TaxID=2617493 RepID=UPI000BC3C1C7|nr:MULTISPECIES: SDR family oxidoreductase [unclassified Acidiphilium]OYV99871.1 MAG: NAD-dependent dehydratase [Acidiphilium sp. 37-64-53]OZB22877.1 MAG: NAD-dependent dehydratase [Acidiphilium sp. 34-64-41]HQT90044.1 SDR family oxidoreductase [Acidiphilium sp.]